MEYLFLLLSLIAIAVLSFSSYNSKLNFSGVIWDIHVPASPKQKAFITRNKLLFVTSVIAFLLLIIPVFTSLLTILFDSFIVVPLYFVALVATIMVSSRIPYKKAMNSPLLLKENNSAVLGSLPFVRSVESQMGEATAFIVSFEGIALINNMNYCYALERYEDYRMGSLTSPNEVAMIGMYFVQKYHHLFNFTVDMERIPGAPGQSVTIIGSSGVNFAYSKGTPDQLIFRSYIFTRK